MGVAYNTYSEIDRLDDSMCEDLELSFYCRLNHACCQSIEVGGEISPCRLSKLAWHVRCMPLDAAALNLCC
jgi:hypothetical protein